MYAKLLQSYPTLCSAMDCSPSGSYVHGKNTGKILKARILDWVAMPSSWGIFLAQHSNHHVLCLLH